MAALDVGAGWVLLMCLLYYVNPLGCFWSFCAAVTAHELGHALALWALRVPIRQLRLRLGGAVLVTGAMDYRRELICALAGPAASLLLAMLGRWQPRLAAVSLCLGAFNLLPIGGLDGGRAVRAALSLRLPGAMVSRIMTGLTIGCTVALAAAALWAGAALGGGVWPILTAAATLLRVGLDLLEKPNCKSSQLMV